MLPRALAVALVLAAAVAFVVLAFAPPAPVPATAAPTEFSAERAMRSLAVIASKPHPTGTRAAEEVREYIEHELEALGFDVEVQDATSLTDRYQKLGGWPVVAAHVRNVVARRHGTSPGPALLLMAHYDSRELAPGASDDGYGTVTLLETARALSASPPLRHDVVLLFTEGEEEGLLGAKAFLEESPVARDVSLVLNFEARGDRGVAFMFQTGDHAGALVDVLASVAPNATASSMSQEVYRRMPNDTDLSLWLRAGYAGMNVANIDGFSRYHQATDTVANADPATVQHHGSYALSLARAFAGRDVVLPPDAGDSVYFVLGTYLFHYSAREAPTFAGFGVGLVLIALGVGLWRGRFQVVPVLGGTAVALLAVAAAAALAWGAWRLVGPSHDGALGMQQARDELRRDAVVGLMLVGAAVVAGGFAAAGRSIRARDLGIGAMLPWAALAVASCVVMPGASYLFTWPLVAGGLAWCARVALPSLRTTRPAAIAVHLVPAVVAIALLLPMGLLLGVVFGPGAAPLLGTIGGVVVMTACPALEACTRGRAWTVPAALAVGAAGFLGVACASAPFDAGSPRPDSLLYAIDADRGEAWWVSFDDAPDAWTGKALTGAERVALPAFFPRSPRAVLQARAPLVTPDPLRLGIVSDEREGATRTVHLHVTLPPGVEAVLFDVPPAAHVTSASVQGKPFSADPKDGWLELAFVGPPATGLDLVVASDSTAPIALRIVAQSRGLPAELAAPFGPRPAGTMPSVGPGRLRASDMTLTTSSFDL